jgi:hypothetical protein
VRKCLVEIYPNKRGFWTDPTTNCKVEYRRKLCTARSISLLQKKHHRHEHRNNSFHIAQDRDVIETMSEGAHYEAYICLLKLRGMSKGDARDRQVRLLLYVDRACIPYRKSFDRSHSDHCYDTTAFTLILHSIIPSYSSGSDQGDLGLRPPTAQLYPCAS